MRFRSKPHVIHAFQFKPDEFARLTPWQLERTLPEWFVEARSKGRASLTFSTKEKHITLVGTGGEVQKARPGEWVCINTLGKMFVLSEEELRKDYELGEA